MVSDFVKMTVGVADPSRLRRLESITPVLRYRDCYKVFRWLVQSRAHFLSVQRPAMTRHNDLRLQIFQ